MAKKIIAIGYTVDGAFVVESASAIVTADIAIAELHAANLRVCQLFGTIPPDATTGLAQHAAVVQAAKAVKP